MLAKKSFQFFFLIFGIFNAVNTADIIQIKQPLSLLDIAHCAVLKGLLSKQITLDDAKVKLPTDLYEKLSILDIANTPDAALLVSKLYIPEIIIQCGIPSNAVIEEIISEVAAKTATMNESIKNKKQRSLQSIFNDTLNAILRAENRNNKEYKDLINKIKIIIDTGLIKVSDKQKKSVVDFNDIQLTEILLQLQSDSNLF
jgi:hypothetical protein